MTKKAGEKRGETRKRGGSKKPKLKKERLSDLDASKDQADRVKAGNRGLSMDCSI